MQDYDFYIGGEWVRPASGERFPTFNPFNQKPWATIAQAGEAEVAQAVAAARATFEKTWRHTTGLERATLMHRLADLIERDADKMGTMESTDNGKIVRETRAQMRFAARVYRFFAGYADKIWGKVIPLDRRDVFDYATMEPLGVIGIITAWNSPMALLANKLPAALAAGNCVVVKPSEHASATTLEFAKLMEEAGFPQRRLQRRDRRCARQQGAGCGRRAGQDQLHRQRPCGARDRRRRRAQPDAGDFGTGRQVSQHHL